VNREGHLTGYNVDWFGAEAALKEVLPIGEKRFLVLGAGGAARSICYALRKHNASIIVLNRDPEKARKLAEDFSISAFGPLSDLSRHRDYDVLVNATSVGFFDTESCPIPEDLVPSNRFVFEAVFYPVKTKLVRLAEERGCSVIPGIRMLVYLAGKQFELYTGSSPRFEVMERALLDGLQRRGG